MAKIRPTEHGAGNVSAGFSPLNKWQKWGSSTVLHRMGTVLTSERLLCMRWWKTFRGWAWQAYRCCMYVIRYLPDWYFSSVRFKDKTCCSETETEDISLFRLHGCRVSVARFLFLHVPSFKRDMLFMEAYKKRHVKKLNSWCTHSLPSWYTSQRLK